MATKRRKGAAGWTCPECEAEVPAGILLCICGYHQQTGSMVDSDRPPESVVDPDRPIQQREVAGGLRYPWLERGASLFVVFAYLSAGVALLRLFGAGMAYAGLDAIPGSKEAKAASLAFILDSSLIIVAGVASYAVFRALADAARALLAMAGALVMLHEEE